MNKLRVIDLLNMISKGEEVPNKIKYRNKIFIYDKDNLCYVVGNYNEYGDLLVWLSNHKGTDLNYEVEVIEEDKKIEKLNIELNSGDENKVNCYRANNLQCDLAFKINEIIDKINEE